MENIKNNRLKWISMRLMIIKIMRNCKKNQGNEDEARIGICYLSEKQERKFRI
jgi:hypothetical protein